MSTKKLQIVTPIVTSVNGKTGDVTLPTALKNPEALTIVHDQGSGVEYTSYDGSAGKRIDIYDPTENLVTTGSYANNPPKSKTVKEALDGKISKAGDTFTGTLTFSNTTTVDAAIDLGKNGYIDNTDTIYFYYDVNGADRGFYIEAAPPETDGHYASAQFWGTDGDELVRLHGIAPPKSDNDAANKNYVDNKVKYLTTDLYGTTLPTTATAGQIFFKKL